jgi:hypothetical protein
MQALRLLSLCLGVLPVIPLHAASTAADPLDKLAAYAGTWQTDIQNFKTPYSNVSRDKTRLENHCWRSNQFYVCNQVADGKSVVVLVFTYLASKGYYVSHAVPGDDTDGHMGRLYIHDNVWTYPWEFNDQGKLVYFRVVNTFVKPGEIDYRQEYSLDHKTWMLMGSGHEVKVR